jgi:hypothetical protein
MHKKLAIFVMLNIPFRKETTLQFDFMRDQVSGQLSIGGRIGQDIIEQLKGEAAFNIKSNGLDFSFKFEFLPWQNTQQGIRFKFSVGARKEY